MKEPSAILAIVLVMATNAMHAQRPAETSAGSVRKAMTGFVYDEIYLRHLAGDTGHPDRPERLTAVQDGLKSKGLLKLLLPIQARKVSDDVLELVHDKDYLALLRREAVDIAGLRMLSTGDTVISPDSLEAAYWAAGGVLSAVDAVMKGEVGNAFAAVRPPGHHATRNRGMGFCIFNNVAVAARYLQQAHGIARVLIVDWDYHHGNGTQDIFYDDPSIFYFSTHDTSAYPGTGSSNETGSGPGAGATLNIPLPRGASDELILEAFQQHLVPAARIFKPDFILISAGFDAMRNDLLGEFDVTPAGFAALTRVVHDLAVELSHGRLVSVLEGGYRLDGLAASVAAHVEVLMEPATSAQSH